MKLQDVRKELERLNLEIINHPILKSAEGGELKRSVIEAFVINQWYIVNHDLRSLSIGLSRSSNMEELDIFKALVDGDYNALKELIKLMRELRIEVKDPLTYKISPKAIAYTHYLAWLANYAKPSEFLFASIVNLPIYAYVVTKFGDSLKKHYGIKETGFFDVFKASYAELEDRIAKLVENEDFNRLKTIGYTIQSYEKEFWDSIYEFNS